MLLKIPCGRCNRVLSLRPEVVGKKVRCPSCQSVFVVESPDEPEPEEVAPEEFNTDDEDESERPRRRSTSIASRRAASQARSYEDDEDDEYDEEEVEKKPRKKKRRNKASNFNSQFWVLAGLSGVAVVGVILLLIFVVPNLFKAKPLGDLGLTWTEFRVPGSNCQLLMPGTPQEESHPLPGTPLTLKVYQVILPKPDSAWGITWVRIPPAEFGLIPVEQRIEGAKKGMLANTPGSTFVSERALTVEGGTAREIVLDVKGKGRLISRVIFIKNDFYTIMVGGSKFQPDTPEVVKFLDSFKLIK